MKAKELQEISNEFLLKLKVSEDSLNNKNSNNIQPNSQKIRKSYSTLNANPRIKTTFKGNLPKKGLNSQKK